jgi:hypothetical protein
MRPRIKMPADFCIILTMDITLNLRDDLVERATALATKGSMTLAQIIEEGLTLRLRNTSPASELAVKELPISPQCGGLRDGIDGTRNRALHDAADE